jgi:hypothetical protein
MTPSDPAWIAEYETEELRFWKTNERIKAKPMTAMTIKYVNPPKPGKKLGTVKDSAGKLYGYNPSELNLTPGNWEVAIESREYSGTTYYNITKASAATLPSTPGGTAPWWMAFVSNVVAHAIEADRITGPLEIGPWAVAAKDLALDLVKPATTTTATVNGREVDLPDDIPF